MNKNYDVIIIGAGVTGSALAYLLAKYTQISRIAILDKYSAIAQVNSDSKLNSQTLHSGDIETNYTLEKAKQVCKAANLVRTYARGQNDAGDIIYASSKLLLGVGEEEREKLKKRYALFKESFPYMQWMDVEKITLLEPNVTKDRREVISAMGTEQDYCAVDFGNLSRSFVKNATRINQNIDVLLEHHAKHIKRTEGGYLLSVDTKNDNRTLHAKFLVFSAGAYSLTYAKSVGYGLNYGLLSVAGSFYFSKEALKGKVYTIQDDKLPFAAVHGDPDVNVKNETRFGPTALILPKLERYKSNTYLDYFKVLGFDKHVVSALTKLLKEKNIRRYILRNFIYELPYFGRHLLLSEVQKIIPSLKASDLRPAKGFGGLRPQVINKDKEQLILGEAHISTEEGLIFNITPSPGASTCLNNALKDAQRICTYLHHQFALEYFCEDFNIDRDEAIKN